MQAPRAIWPALVGLSPQPVITSIDTDSGVRVELSGPSLANAAAKIANALVLEFDLAAGDAIELALPWHWQRAAWQAGCLTAGVQWSTRDGRDAQGWVRIRDEQFDISLHPFGLPLHTSQDITPLIQAQPDSLIINPVTATDELHRAFTYGSDHGVAPGDRVLVRDTDSFDDQFLPLLVPLALHGSLVMGSGAGPWDRIVESEGITRLWA